MTDQLPGWAKYANDIRTALDARIDKEIEDRTNADKDLENDITELSKSRTASRTWWVRSIIITVASAVTIGLVTLIVTLIASASHLQGGTP